MRRLDVAVWCFAFLTWTNNILAGSWPQFRGAAGKAVADDGLPLPAQIGPEQNVLWKVPLPPRHSSPILHGQNLYLTAVDHKKLYTLGLDSMTGKVLWRAEAPTKALEKIHQVGSYAQPTPATDGQHVVSFFGSSGLYGFDTKGKELWRKPMGPFKTEFGSATSPLLIDGRVILNQDLDSESSLQVFDVRTGQELWKIDRSEFPVGYATPVIWEVDGKKQIVQAGSLRVVGYDLETGKEVWTVRGLSRIINMTPAIGPDNTLYVPAWAPGADPGERIELPAYDEIVTQNDKDKNGTLEIDEVPMGPFRDRFAQFDGDKDKHVTRIEWDKMRLIFQAAVNRMVAIKPGGCGDVTKSHVLWEQTKNLPYVPSPLCYKDTLFLVKNGGFLTSYDAKSGQVHKYDRIPGAANYYASPVGGDGKVYMLSQRGELTVVSATGQWQVLHRARFNEEVFATPAIVDGRIYVRTTEYLYCFGRGVR